MTIRKAVAGLITTISGLLIIAAFAAGVVGLVECNASCKAWRQRYVGCEQPGCKDALLERRPVGCKPRSAE